MPRGQIAVVVPIAQKIVGMVNFSFRTGSKTVPNRYHGNASRNTIAPAALSYR
jgi:hypothetical protein